MHVPKPRIRAARVRIIHLTVYKVVNNTVWKLQQQLLLHTDMMHTNTSNYSRLPLNFHCYISNFNCEARKFVAKFKSCISEFARRFVKKVVIGP